MIQQDEYRPAAPYRLAGTTYLHLAPQPFTQLEMPLSRAFQRLVEGSLIAPLPPRPPPHPTLPGFRTDLHCAYHQRAGHDTNNCRRVSSILLDNGFALNVCPLVTVIALGFSPSDFGPSTQTVRAYNGTQRTVIGSRHPLTCFLGRPWIHEASAIPSSFHQKVISLEDDSRDMVPMSFDQYNSTLVLSMMRGKSYMPGLGLGHRQQGPREFAFIVDHDISYGLGYTPSEEDARHMVRLHRNRVRACLSGVPFDYPLRPYTFQLADYFTRGSEHAPRTEGVDRVPEAVEIQGIQQALGQMCLSSETTEPPKAMIDASSSPDRASVFCMCFPEEIPDYELPMDLGDGSDGVILPETYMDEMDMIGIGCILDTALRGPHSVFDMFGVSMIDSDDVTLYD
ncbi:hypothetical protein CK203_065624, partial [Vitis vinifera]